MKKLLSTIASGLLLTSSLWAVPSLQLDIDPGTSDGDTTISDGPIFELQALGDLTTLQDPSGVYFISAAIVPKTPLTTDFGSFTIDGITYDSSNMDFGVPPLDATANPRLGDHGIYDTSFAEIAFTFDPLNLVPSYNTQDGSLGPGFLSLHTFAVDVTGLGDGFAVHFDLYNTATRNGDVIRGEFAPFSHDAQSGNGNGVPDGGTTLMLLGSALACLGALRRRFA